MLCISDILDRLTRATVKYYSQKESEGKHEKHFKPVNEIKYFTLWLCFTVLLKSSYQGNLSFNKDNLINLNGKWCVRKIFLYPGISLPGHTLSLIKPLVAANSTAQEILPGTKQPANGEFIQCGARMAVVQHEYSIHTLK